MAFVGSLIRTRDVPPTAWKNGAGVTREIAAYRTPGASDVDWRISVADLARDAAFSRFPGLDRTFVVVSRTSVVLEVDAAATVLGQGDSLAFRGEAETNVVLTEGPATALNVMTARAWKGLVRVVDINGGELLTPCTVAVLVLEGSASTSRGEALEPMDVFLCGTDVETLQFTTACAAFIEVQRR